MVADHRPRSDLVLDGWSQPCLINFRLSTCSKNFFLNLHILSRSDDAVMRLKWAVSRKKHCVTKTEHFVD